MEQARVVAAVSPALRQRMRVILPDCDLRFVADCDDLARELDHERCDMLIVGSHFDDSSAVAALERVRKRPESFPVVCVRGVRSRFGTRSLHALRMALSELGARNFIDLVDYPDDESGNARVRAMLEPFIPRRSA